MKKWIREEIARKDAEQNPPNNPEEEKQPMADEPKEQTFTQSQFEQMMQMFAQFQEGSNKNLLEAMKVLKEPDEYTKEKQDKQRQRELEHRVNRMRASVEDERKNRSNWFNCQHIKLSEGVMKQSHAFVSQVNNDMCFRPICCRCQRTFPKVKATDEQIRNGVSLKTIQGLTADILLRWHIKTIPDCKECAKNQCAVQQLRELHQGHLDPAPEILATGKVSADSVLAQMEKEAQPQAVQP